MNYEKSNSENRRAILECAKQCFYKNGIFGVTIKEIAEAAGVSRPTVYKYFPTVRSVATCINDECTRHFVSYVADDREGGEISAFESLRNILVKTQSFCTEYPDEIFFISAFSKNLASSPDSRDRLAENLYIRKLTDFIKRGRENGEIRTDADTSVLRIMTVNTVFGIAKQLVIIKDTLTEDAGMTPTDFINGTYDMLRSYLSVR